MTRIISKLIISRKIFLYSYVNVSFIDVYLIINEAYNYNILKK